ncbi:1,4-alpha-glucan branching enzyme [Trueperella bonasi]|uniref:Maltokinase n=1 Tax=Trueperella bonasi TaxID=312286 RepID=A0ABT9NHF4_9ACTO|nr:phosphotransferase [Trueperella bonasi]MDP9806774.1 1,4-alpha-glucan branching enzyme [Trueperella bonasi]
MMGGWTATPTELAEATGRWLTSTRWFTGDPSDGVVFTHASPIESSQNVSTVMFLVRSGELTFCVPLTFREGPDSREGIGSQPIGNIGQVQMWDATDDVDGQRALLNLLSADRDDQAGAFRLSARPIRSNFPAVASSHRLTSEQSNTSIIYRFVDPDDGAAGIILKVFRVLSDGANPDVELQQALDAAGSHAVPRQYGSVRGAWDGNQTDVAVAQEFLVGALDAWQVITGALAAGNFEVSDEIRGLGSLTAQIHRDLATAFGTATASDDAREQLVGQWRNRANRALADAPQLDQYREAIDSVFASVSSVQWPPLQRIHGDYHLGQVLHVPDRGWVALDFEGEPLRPLSERVQPDLALRDVAGILRSFDYAAGTTVRQGGDSQAAASWYEGARDAFLAGYGELSESEEALLEALMLDKALYEVSYESASRPDWIDIPVGAVRRQFASE